MAAVTARCQFLAWVVVLGLSSCDFDKAFKRYCENNPKCFQDAGGTSEVGPDAAGPDAAGPDANDAAADAFPLVPPPFPRSCGSCASNEVCRTASNACLQTCTTVADCPPWHDSCQPLPDPKGGPDTPPVCICTSAQVCANFGDYSCNGFENQCEKLCSAQPGSQQVCAGFQPARLCLDPPGWCEPTLPACLSNLDCTYPTAPRCDPLSLWCVGCAGSRDCAGRPDGLTVCAANGSCVSP